MVSRQNYFVSILVFWSWTKVSGFSLGEFRECKRNTRRNTQDQLSFQVVGTRSQLSNHGRGSLIAWTYSHSDSSLGVRRLFSSPEENNVNGDESPRTARMRQKMASLARNIVVRPIASAAPVPGAIAAILKDATLGAVDMAVEEVMSRRSAPLKGTPLNVEELIDEAFAPMEASLQEMEQALATARTSLEDAKLHATSAIQAVQAAAIAQAEGAAVAMAAAEDPASLKAMKDVYNTTEVDVASLTYDDVGYHLSEMSPPFLDEDQCLVPGEAIVRVEKAPENSRRIFAGIDIPVSVDTVWQVSSFFGVDHNAQGSTLSRGTLAQVLTDYSKLQEVIPNLVVNKVLEEYDAIPYEQVHVDPTKSDEGQCEQMSKQLKGSLLKQVGGARVVGIKFSARTTLEVREWPQGMPDFAHFRDAIFEGRSRDARAKDDVTRKLQRYRFPRPFALSQLPTRDISMQSIENDDGEFRMYQGVWRLQPLPGCAPEGQDAMRLTYAVEVSPRAYLPVSLVEGRIVRDLCTNLVAIRDFVTSQVPATV